MYVQTIVRQAIIMQERNECNSWNTLDGGVVAFAEESSREIGSIFFLAVYFLHFIFLDCAEEPQANQPSCLGFSAPGMH